MKRICSLTISILLIFSFSVSALAYKSVKIDGEIGNSEWINSNALTLFTERTNPSNKINQVSVRSKFEEDNYFLYLGFGFTVSNSPQNGSKNTGIILNLEGCDEEFRLTFENAELKDGEIENYENVTAKNSVSSSGFTVTGAMKYYKGQSVSCEIEIESKKGLPENVCFEVSFIDAEGEKSSFVPVKVENTNITTTRVISPTTAAKEKTTKEKTTKEKTTKATTLKETTTQPKTHRVDRNKTSTTVKATTQKTTAVKTTAEKTTASKVTTTKAEKVKTSKAKASEAAKKKSTKRSAEKTGTAYYYEKEIIVSEVSNSAAETTAQSVFGFSNVPKSTVYKIITGVCAGVLFGIIGIWAVRSKSEEKHEEEKEEQE